MKSNFENIRSAMRLQYLYTKHIGSVLNLNECGYILNPKYNLYLSKINLEYYEIFKKFM